MEGDRPPPRYISMATLAEMTPWSKGAIRRMIQRGVLRRDTHFFQPSGDRGKLLFDWVAVEALIRHGDSGRSSREPAKVNVHSIQEEARSLLAGAAR